MENVLIYIVIHGHVTPCNYQVAKPGRCGVYFNYCVYLTQVMGDQHRVTDNKT